MDRLFRSLLQFAGGAQGALQKGLTFGENFAAFTKTVNIQGEPDTSSPTLVSGWVPFGGAYALPTYRKAGGQVIISGVIKSGTIGATAFILPVGYRPAASLIFPTICNNSTTEAITRCEVSAAGVFTAMIGGAAGYNAYLSLSSVAFDAADRSPVPNPAFPVSIGNDLPGGARPAHVLITHAEDVTGQTSVPVSLGSPAWTSSADKITVRDVTGIQPSRKYSVTFLVIGG